MKPNFGRDNGIVAMALIPGLRFAAENAVENLNQALRTFDLPEVALMQLPRRRNAASRILAEVAEEYEKKHLQDEPAPERKRKSGRKKKAKAAKVTPEMAGRVLAEEKAKVHVMPRLSAAVKRRLSEQKLERWRIVKEANLPTGKMPTNEEVEHARKILRAREKRAMARAQA
jgi:hypothetical protein